jgi:phosphoribosyl-ATP pyrophosphohydrolase
MTATPAKKSTLKRRGQPLDRLAPHLHEFNLLDARAVNFAAAGTSDDPMKGPQEIELLYSALSDVSSDKHPRTARLLASSRRKVAQKVIEEAGEVALAAVKHNARNIVRESADLLYQLAVLWHREGIPPQEIWAEMRHRADMLGIAEKLPKSNKPD